MPWYLIYANHGPGHQSRRESYLYFENPLKTRDQKKEIWECEMGTLYDPIGDVKEVAGLPAHMLKGRIAASKEAIAYHTRMLGILASTKTIPVIAVRYEFKPIDAFQARLLDNEEVRAEGKTRDKAVNALLRKIKAKRKDYAVITR
jgi:hypothetical protein